MTATSHVQWAHMGYKLARNILSFGRIWNTPGRKLAVTRPIMDNIATFNDNVFFIL